MTRTKLVWAMAWREKSNEIQPVIIMGLYHHRDLIGSPNAFTKVSI